MKTPNQRLHALKMPVPTPLQVLTVNHAAELFQELHDPALRAPTYQATDVHLEDCPSRTKCTLGPEYQESCTCPEAVTVVVIRRKGWPTTDTERRLPGEWDFTGA